MTPLAGVIIGYLFGSRDVSGDKKSPPRDETSKTRAGDDPDAFQKP
jgi:hypothetical protein